MTRKWEQRLFTLAILAATAFNFLCGWYADDRLRKTTGCHHWESPRGAEAKEEGK